MTLGINVTTNDPTFDWDYRCVHKKPADVIEAELAQDVAEEKWQFYVDMVDTWIERGDYVSLRETKTEAIQLQREAWKLAQQIHCPHKNTYTLGSRDDEIEVCSDCGKRGFLFHESIVAETTRNSENCKNIP